MAGHLVQDATQQRRVHQQSLDPPAASLAWPRGLANRARPNSDEVDDGVMKTCPLPSGVEALGIDGKPFAESNTVPGLEQTVKYDPATKVLLLGPPTVFTKENVDQYKF